MLSKINLSIPSKMNKNNPRHHQPLLFTPTHKINLNIALSLDETEIKEQHRKYIKDLGV